MSPRDLGACGGDRAAGPRPGDEKQSAAELDLVLQRQQQLQEKLAEEMLGLARSLKTNQLAAQSVIKMDNQVQGRGGRAWAAGWDFVKRPRPWVPPLTQSC